ncbi:MAG TPA: SpoIID/LytB domain-containing protein [Gemmatimonadaceae bacterium]
MRSAFVLGALFLGACAGTVRHPIGAPTPVPVAAGSAEPRSNIPPLTLPPDSAARADGAGSVQVADVPVTVLPTIIGHRVTPGLSDGRAAGGVSREDNDQTVRIALALRRRSARIYATGAWNLYDGPSGKLLAHVSATDSFTVEVRDGMLVAGGSSIAPSHGPVIARPAESGALVCFDGHRYRGEIGIAVSDDGVSVINRVAVEDYLRGVVPLEIGTDRTAGESAAVEAQAIAARSYTYTRMDDSRPYDMVATTTDQVYGGADAERPLSDAAVRVTHNMVMMYDGKVINAPYHSNSGGVTAAASEVWRSADEPYLVSVSDRIPGTDHYYGEDSPRFKWTRSLDASALSALLDRYLPQYSSAPRGRVGTLRKITETGRTPSGRVAGLIFETDRGSFAVRGNDVRFVLRSSGGDILPSTLFSFEQSTDRDGHVTQLTITGNGNGHGVGMDQWGAIARARAGQDVVTILHTYYPGTTIGRVI